MLIYDLWNTLLILIEDLLRSGTTDIVLAIICIAVGFAMLVQPFIGRGAAVRWAVFLLAGFGPVVGYVMWAGPYANAVVLVSPVLAWVIVLVMRIRVSEADRRLA